jgi:hypothetical protein
VGWCGGGGQNGHVISKWSTRLNNSSLPCTAPDSQLG